MKFLKSIRKETLAAAIMYIAAGLILVLFPETTARTIGYAFACILLILGLRSVFNYMMREVCVSFYHYDLVIASILIIASVAVFINVDAVVGFIPFILGIFVTISGAIKLQNAIDLKRLNNGGFFMVFIFALVNIVLGIILILNPFDAMTTLIVLIGIGLIYSGITDLTTMIFITRKIKKYEQANSVIEGEILDK
jgi:uncharacterized membrane protein HdeD (DUF308 family)